MIKHSYKKTVRLFINIDILRTDNLMFFSSQYFKLYIKMKKKIKHTKEIDPKKKRILMTSIKVQVYSKNLLA